MHCPRCQRAMSVVHEGLYEDILVHRCECSVLWMSAESLDRLDDNIHVDASALGWLPAPRADAHYCPTCPGHYRGGSPTLAPQRLGTRSEIQIQRCPKCQWLLLDEATLEAIRGHVAGMEVPDVVSLPLPRRRN